MPATSGGLRVTSPPTAARRPAPPPAANGASKQGIQISAVTARESHRTPLGRRLALVIPPIIYVFMYMFGASLPLVKGRSATIAARTDACRHWRAGQVAGRIQTEDDHVVMTVFGAAAVTAMLVFYALEARSPVFVLLFARACLA
jgi:hypothetical protein